MGRFYKIDLGKLTKIPFDDLKCFELVSKAYSLIGVDIGDYTDDSYPAKWERVRIGEAKKGDMVQISPPKDAKRNEFHVGMYAGDGKMLHTIEGLKSRINRVEAYLKAVDAQVVGVYRWRG